GRDVCGLAEAAEAAAAGALASAGQRPGGRRLRRPAARPGDAGRAVARADAGDPPRRPRRSGRAGRAHPAEVTAYFFAPTSLATSSMTAWTPASSSGRSAVK